MEKLQLGRKRKTDAEKPRMDPLMRALKALHSAGSPEAMTPEELEHQRRNQEILGRLTAPMAGMEYEELSIGTMPAAWTRLKAPHGDRRVILYCHGGGYTSGNLGYSRVLSSKLAHVTGYDVLSFEYRLAPEHPYPAAVEDAMRAWDYLMYRGYGAENVTVTGDSAGGNLALVLCRRLKAAGRWMPRALLLMSPWTDMTMSGASYRERVESDPMLTPEYIEAVRRAYAGDRDLHDPDLSPLLGDLGSFPPTLIPRPWLRRCGRPMCPAGWRSARECGTYFRCSPSKKRRQPWKVPPGFCWSYKNEKACSKERAFCFCSQVRSRRRMGRMYLKAAVLWQTGTGG